MELTELIIKLSQAARGKEVRDVKILIHNEEGAITICNIFGVIENPQMPGAVIIECRKTKL